MRKRVLSGGGGRDWLSGDVTQLLEATHGAWRRRCSARRSATPSTASLHVPRRQALVVRQQRVRWTYRGFTPASTRSPRVSSRSASNEAIGSIWSPNNAEWVIAQLATARAGIILVSINPA
jgi:acyl-CoA synthetase (AMP-forming)/AMP-acid ligase II